MNISTEYAPTDGMSRSSYTRSSYRSAYYGGPPEIGGSGAGALGSQQHQPPYGGGVETIGFADGGSHSRRHHDRSASMAMGGSFEGDCNEKPFYAPSPLGSDSYASDEGRHSGGYLANPYYGATAGGGGYGHQGSMVRAMPPELGMYGGGCYGSPPVPWYQLPQQQQQPSSYHQQQHPGHSQHHHHHHHHHPHPHHSQQQHSASPRCYPMPPEHMYNMFNFNRNGREARNRAEKNRRDKLNGSIQELSAMVPHVAESPRRVDKTAVLRFSAHGLRVDYVFGKSKPEETVKPEAQDSLFRMLNGFLLTVTCRGQIVLVSPSVEQFLGHCQTDLYGQNLFNLTHPDDHALLKQQLIPSNLVNMFDNGGPSTSCGAPPALLGSGEGGSGTHGTDGGGEFQRSYDDEEEIDRKLRQDHRRFTIRMARAGPRSEATTYELVTIDGCFRRADSAPRGSSSSSSATKAGAAGAGGTAGSMQMIRRVRGRDDAIPLHSINGNDIVLIALARVMKVPSICDRLIEACKYEYKTRHLIDGRIVQCDQRISIVAGYLTDEVSGLSPFTFMHRDDVRWVIVALRQMYDYNQNGESCYRLMSRTGDFIYLKTRGYLEVDSDTKVVQSFVCINTLVSEEEGQRLVREMKRKFSVIVDKVELPDESGEPVVENPKQIEEAVMNLITNLQPDSEDKLLNTMPASPASSIKSGYGEGAPLAIVAPEKNSVKSAIVKSINVVSIAAKTMREGRCSSVSGGDWSPLGGDQQNSNGSSGTASSSVSTGMPSPSRSAFADGIGSPPPPPPAPPQPSLSPGGAQRPTVLQKLDPPLSEEAAAVGANVEQRVPPLPNSQHYFTQPFSPSGGTTPVPVSLLSPASSHYSQRSARSPYGGCGSGIASPPAGIHGGGGGGSRTTTVLKRTYSNSSINSLNSLDNYGDGGEAGTGDSGKRARMHALGNSDLANCFSDLINPGSDLTSLLPNSFEALDQSLLTMETTTTIIRDRVSGYSSLHESQNRLDRIVEEHQEQREMLQSIQQEYQLQMQSNGTGSDAIGAGNGSGGGGGGDEPDGMLCNSLSQRVSTITSTMAAATPPLMMPSVITSSVGQQQQQQQQRTAAATGSAGPVAGTARSEKDAGS